MIELPNTLPFLSYSDATKHEINQISHILKRSTSQPCLQILLLPPMLSQTKSENIQLQNIPSIPVPAPRVEPFFQPPRGQTHQYEPIPPTREKLSTPPSLDPHPNPLIKKITKYLKTPQIPKSRKTQAAPRKVQHQLRRSLCNFRKISAPKQHRTLLPTIY